MSVAIRTCRTCGKTSEVNDTSNLLPLYNSVEYETELKMTLQEFELWNLNISQNDGLPQKICLNCLDSFCQIHNFRVMCNETQMNFGEMCTGLDIFIKEDSDNLSENCSERSFNEHLVTVQEYYSFPGDEILEKSNAMNDHIDKTELEIAKFEEELSTKEEHLSDKEDDKNADNYESEEYRCDFCMEIVNFDDSDQLNEHVNEMHSSTEPYPCPKCDKFFEDRVKRNKHARYHYKTLLCCEICGKKVRGDEMIMAKHIDYEHTKKNRSCPTCGKKFEMVPLRTLTFHLGLHGDSKLHKCKFCNKKFIRTTHLLAHEKTHDLDYPYSCAQCGLAFQKSEFLSKHVLTHETINFECPECFKKCANGSGLTLHMQIHKEGVKRFHCELCNKTYGNGINLKLHNYKHHGGPPSQTILNILGKKQHKTPLIKPFKCDMCIDSFVLHSQLIKHLKMHDEDRPYVCNICRKPFKRDAHLKLHMDSIHLNKRPHKCSICKKTFQQSNNLKEHIATKHSGTKNFECHICERKFKLLKYLNTHMLRHSDRKPYFCKVCNKAFKKLNVLRIHMDRHLKNNEADINGRDITDIFISEEDETKQIYL